MVALHSVVTEDVFWDVMEKLRDAGARYRRNTNRNNHRMKLLTLDALEDEDCRSLLRSSGSDDDVTRSTVATICRNVRERGDVALIEYTRLFDEVELKSLRVDTALIARAFDSITSETRSALETAAENIGKFHAAQSMIEPPVETMPGVLCWRERRAIDAVGLYVPGGNAPLLSTVLMLGVPANLAGCRRIVLVTPPNGAGVADEHVLAAAAVVGVDEVYCVGGAQAIAALAYGTESLARVDKIFGPGNRFVVAAKRHVAADGVAVDLSAGPTELLIIADETADPSVLAADLLAQAEHDADARVTLVTTSARLASSTLEELRRQVSTLPRAGIISQALAGSCTLVVDSIDDALRISNDYGPEHLQLNVRNPSAVARKVTAAGSVFLGPWTPVSAGDYASGTNHTLPTGGAARATSGLSLDDFQTTISFQTITKQGLEALAPTLVTLASEEGLDAHARSVRARLDVSAERYDVSEAT